MWKTHSVRSIALLLADWKNFTVKSRVPRFNWVRLLVLTNFRQLDPEAMVAAVRALEALAHERAVAKLQLQSDDSSPGPDNREYQLPYDPASVFLLETMVSISCQASQYIEDLWWVLL